MSLDTQFFCVYVNNNCFETQKTNVYNSDDINKAYRSGKMADVSLIESIPANKKIEANVLFDDKLLENIF